MKLLALGEGELDRCSSCGGIWLDAGEELKPDAGVSTVGRYLLYSMSLPERALRSAIGLGAGAAKEVAELIVPRSFQSAKTYQVVVRNSFRFLTEDIAGVKSKGDSEEGPSDYMARKAVGNFVDLAGIVTLHVSPLWLLAILSDVAYGTKTYVRELADELKSQGLIDESSTINSVDDVLDAVQSASGQTATLFDTPPLSVEQLKATLKDVKTAVTSTDYRRILPESELKQYWQEMRDVAARENVSLLGVSAGLTMRTFQKLGAVSSGALAGMRVAGNLFNRHVLGHYVGSLQEMRERGFYPSVRESYAPYVDAVWSNFAGKKTTVTEEVLSGRAFGRALEKLSGWFRRRPAQDEQEEQSRTEPE
jgi:hypothetical protein